MSEQAVEEAAEDRQGIAVVLVHADRSTELADGRL